MFHAFLRITIPHYFPVFFEFKMDTLFSLKKELIYSEKFRFASSGYKM